MNIKTLNIDLECYSDVDLKKCGVYKYSESPNFEILLFGVSVNGGDVMIYDLASGEKLPDDIIKALTDDAVIKWAYNASFERVCLSSWLRRNYPQNFISYGIDEDTVRNYLDPSSWRCSMIWGAYLGLPLSLESIGSVLNLKEQKMSEGKALIRYFCVPCKPTATNGNRTRNLPEHEPEKWRTFKEYNKRDVETEMAIQERLVSMPVPDFLWEEYHIDQEINDRGIQVDKALVDAAIEMDKKSTAELMGKIKKLTGLENPNSVQQMKAWLAEHGLKTDSLGKKSVAELLKTAPPDLAEVLELRQQLAKSSVKKYQAMQNAACADRRARGMFQFYGANRTGRWCLAKGSPVLVKDTDGNIYEKPIEDVDIDDLVFDGENWVRHEGVVYSGDKDVITWDGITATPEHKVFIDSSTQITLDEAKERRIPIWKVERKLI